jgi:hypothetical protein
MGNGFKGTGVAGYCSKCHLWAELEIPENWPTAKVERVQERRVIKAFCPKCLENTEFIPGPDGDANTPAQKMMQEAEKRIGEELLAEVEATKAAGGIILPEDLMKVAHAKWDAAKEEAKKAEQANETKIIVVSR